MSVFEMNPFQAEKYLRYIAQKEMHAEAIAQISIDPLKAHCTKTSIVVDCSMYNQWSLSGSFSLSYMHTVSADATHLKNTNLRNK